MHYPEGPFFCDICGHGFRYIHIIRVVPNENFTRIILQLHCHNEKAHEVIPHLVRISARIENIIAHDLDGQGWTQIPEAAVLKDFDYYEERKQDDLIDKMGPCYKCLDNCRDCPEMPNGPNAKED